MLSKSEAGKKRGGDSGNGKLLQEIESISKALYLDKNPPTKLFSTPNTRSKSAGKTHLPERKSKTKPVNEDPSQKDKKSFWNWKPLKAFSLRNRRFNCCFTLHVHSIEGLSSNFSDVSLCVHWKRRDGGLVTRPAKVFQGIAEFDESLSHACSVYGSRNGANHSAKYDAKHFLLYASVFGAPELDLGKHRVDLTRLLPLTLEELEEEKCSGKWTTTYKLSGKAKGATLNVSFGYSVIREPSNDKNVPEMLNSKQNNLSRVKSVVKTDQSNSRNAIRRVESLPSNSYQRVSSSRSVDDIKILHEVLPISKSELSSSVNILYQKLDEVKLDISIDYKPELDVFTDLHSLSDSGKENVKSREDNEFYVTERGIELPSKEEEKLDEGTLKAAAIEPIDDVEIDSGVGVTLEEDTKLHPEDDKHGACGDELVSRDCNPKENDICTKESLMKELEIALDCVSNLEAAGLDSPEHRESYMEVKSHYNKKGKSLSLDDVTESVASEFLNLLGIEHSPFGLSSESEPDSPRERLLRQFEKDSLGGGFPLFDFDVNEGNQAGFGYNAPTGSEWGNLSEDIKFSSAVEAFNEYNAPTGSEWGNLTDDIKLSSAAEAVTEEHMVTIDATRSKTRAKMLEDLETEALMNEWGLDEKAFQFSPPDNDGAFGSPIHIPPEEPAQLPPLGEGLGPFIQTKNGGFLRSMNPALFKNAKSGGSLVMQVSSPVVVPAEMGSGIMEILQRLASVGIEKLSMQANKLMPLEDVTGKTMQQIAWEAVPNLEAPDSHFFLQHESMVGQGTSAGAKKVEGKSIRPMPEKFDSSSIGNEMGSEYVSLEDLAPLAMDKIEALSIEGLRIQSGMSDEDAPSNISAQSIGDISTLEGKGVNITGSLGLEGTAGLQLLDIKDSGDEGDGLMGLSLTLDEWMRLDSGDFDDEDQISERTSKILAAHHANSLDFIRGGSKGEKRRGKSSNRKCGLLGNNFTVALMVQLRDPLRNYEPVGAPMLSLIQVERVFVPPKPKIYSTISELRSRIEEDDESELAVKEEIKEDKKEEKNSEGEGIALFKITEVHVAGLKTEPSKKKLWGSKNQQQSGSRWLVANGMGKSNKHPFMKSKAVAKSTTPATTTVQPGDTLWSISSRVHGTGAKWKELAALNPHIRNPNVIFPNEKIRLC